jgi:membrane protease YdiL (CAAX protease family)
MHQKRRTIAAIVIFILGFGLMHSLTGVPEIINLTAMGLCLLYLMVQIFKSMNKPEDS